MNLRQPKTTPRRAYGEGSLTRRRDLWVARIELPPTTDADGKPVRRRLEKSSRSQRAVLDWMAKTKASVARGDAVAEPSVTVQAWARHWLERKAHRVRPGSIATYRARIDNWVIPVIGSKRLGKVTAADVRRVTDRMRDAGKSPRTMATVHTTLGAMLESAVREGILTANPQRRVEAPTTFPGRRSAFTATQAAAIMGSAAPAGQTRAIAALLTGMRQSELLGLTWECVDLDSGSIEVAWQLRCIHYVHGCGTKSEAGWACGRRRGMDCPTGSLTLPDGLPARHLVGSWWLIPPKTGKARAVPLEPRLVAVLQHHREATAGEPNPHGLVWHRPDGRPITPHEDAGTWRAVVTAAGLPAEATTHWARHTVATLLLEASVDAKVAGEILGHARIETTRGTYQHVSSDLARAGMAKMGELLG